MARIESTRRGAQRLRGTVLQLKRKLAQAQAELKVTRAIVLAARKYIATGRDQELRRVIEECGLEEPPRKAKPRSEPDPPALPHDGPGFHPHEGLELI